MKLCKECAKKVSCAGQAFTNYECSLCKETKSYHNTNTPKICLECAEKNNLCQRCMKRVIE